MGGGRAGQTRQKQQGEDSKQSSAKQKRQGKTRQGRAGTKHTTSSEGRKREEAAHFFTIERSNGIPAGMRTKSRSEATSRVSDCT